MLTAIQLRTMLTLQDKMNKAVNEDWLQRNRAWTRAAMMESVELIEHVGQWKWWKHMDKDLAQGQMELVDIWHFALSAVLVEFDGDLEQSAQTIAQQLADKVDTVTFDGKDYTFTALPLLEQMDLMTGLCAAKRFNVPLFISIMEGCELSSEELYRQYVGKNILNLFRQGNGYKTGTYTKIWNGREDNEHLVEIMNSLDSTAEDFASTLHQKLDERYKSL